MRKLAILILFLIATDQLSAQNTVDVGVWGGVGTYFGDMNQIALKESLGGNYGGFIRFNLNSRIGARIQLVSGLIKADGLFDNTPWAFSKNVINYSLLAEINFFKYFLGREETPFTTYLLCGIGMGSYVYTYDYAILNSTVTYLYNPVISNTLGMNVNYNRNYLIFQIPFGFGLKTNLGKKTGIGIELLMHKYLDDRLDDLDDPRKYYQVINDPVTSNDDITWVSFNDRWHNNDYSVYLGIHLTYNINMSKKSCPVFEYE